MNKWCYTYRDDGVLIEFSTSEPARTRVGAHDQMWRREFLYEGQHFRYFVERPLALKEPTL